MKVDIRSFSEKDLPTFVKLLNEARKSAYEYLPFTEEEVEERLRGSRSKVLIAEEGDEIVGTITYNDGYWGEELRWLAVRVVPDQKLIEDALVREAEKLVRRGTVFTSVDDGSPKTTDWIDRGYAPSARVVVTWPATEFNAYYKTKRGYLGPAATLPEYCGKKLASSLTVRAMNVLFEKGMNTAVLHTSELNVPSVTLLRQIGFQVGHHIKFLKKNVPHTDRVDRNLIDEKPKTSEMDERRRLRIELHSTLCFSAVLLFRGQAP